MSPPAPPCPHGPHHLLLLGVCFLPERPVPSLNFGAWVGVSVVFGLGKVYVTFPVILRSPSLLLLQEPCFHILPQICSEGLLAIHSNSNQGARLCLQQTTPLPSPVSSWGFPRPNCPAPPQSGQGLQAQGFYAAPGACAPCISSQQ